MVRVLGILVLTVSFAAEAGVTLEQVQKALGKRGGWVAGHTSVSRLSDEEKSRLNGAILDEGFGDVFSSADESAFRGPSRLDWRDHAGVDMTSPILNQGRCGSCVAFAAVTTLETQMNIARNTPYSPWTYSTQHLFSCGGGGCKTGWRPSSAARFLKDKGVPDEACFPYQSGAMGDDVACSNSCAGAASRSQKIQGSYTPTFWFVNVDAIKKALKKGPLMTVMKVYDDFFYYKSGVYKTVVGEMKGGHAITIIGYDDAKRAWIVANSWGTDWGDNGIFMISWDDTKTNLGSSTWGFNIAPSGGFVTLGGLRDHEVLTGTVDLKVISTFKTRETGWELRRPGSLLPVAWDDVGTGVGSLDTGDFEDGVYEIRAWANVNGGKEYGRVKLVYLLNGDLEGNVRLTSHKDGDKVKGKVIFELDTESAPIPFNGMRFIAENVQTGEKVVRQTSNVASKMKFSWRTQKIAKGDYRITFEGVAGDKASIASGTIQVTVEAE